MHRHVILSFYLGWTLFSLALNWISRWIPASSSGLASYVLISVSLLFLSSLTFSYRRRLEPSLQQSQGYRIAGLAVGLLLFALVYILVGTMGVRSNVIMAFHTANLLFMACMLGHWLVVPLKRPAELVPLCLVVSLVDIYSVFQGPTKSMTGGLSNYYSSGQVGAPPFIDFVLVKFPMPGLTELQPLFGIADWIIIAMLSAAAAKFNMRDNLFGQTTEPFVSIATAGLLLSIVLAREVGLYLPALPLIALTFLIVMILRYPEVRQLTRNELRPLGLFFTLAAVLIIFATQG